MQALVGASLLAKAACQSLTMLNVTTPSRAGSLLQGGCEYSPHKNLYTDYNLYNYLDLSLNVHSAACCSLR
ncbi:hypothetical protein EMIT0232MI5_10191 [Pseudomonas sp. IT-232MI5]